MELRLLADTYRNEPDEKIRKQARERLGFTQAEVANKVGVKQNAISNYEKGIRYPRLDELEHIAKALKRTPPELIR